ncbi:hypothetical protein [Neisseria sp. Ec49-e6-T10]|uniref:hypothetical protein n=1 Tax=Neisseria sp. Ec49-e6-T10 TaxID=3140744 RepID=UPI003EBFDA7C
MKKLILLPLLFLSIVHAEPLPPVCQENKWAMVEGKTKKDLEHEKLYGYSKPMSYCILPNEKYYSIVRLYNQKKSKYKNLFNQYSGQSPTFEQIEKAKEQMRKDGYIVIK